MFLGKTYFLGVQNHSFVIYIISKLGLVLSMSSKYKKLKYSLIGTKISSEDSSLHTLGIILGRNSQVAAPNIIISVIPVLCVCLKTNGKVVGPSVTQIYLSIRRYVLH